MTKEQADNKVAIVTGASRGIGRAIALRLAAEGNSVVVNYRANAEAATAVVAEIEANGGQAVAVSADISTLTAAQSLIDKTLELYGQIDVLVNNAGKTDDALLMRMKEDQWDSVIDTNLKSVFNCCKAALRPMLRRKRGGRIINISSPSGLIGMAGQTNYAASKAGIHGFTKSLAREVGARQITVNAVAPGLVLTDLTADVNDVSVEEYKRLTALGRLGQADEVANLVAFLASDLASYITGEIIRVDGGFAM